MEETKPQPKEINVKRIFFIDNGNIPCFELEDNSIKRPYFMQTITGQKLYWFTDTEMVKVRADIDKQKNKTNIKLIK